MWEEVIRKAKEMRGREIARARIGFNKILSDEGKGHGRKRTRSGFYSQKIELNHTK